MVGDPQGEAQASLRISRFAAGRAFDCRVELQQILERSLKLANRPASCLRCKLLDPERMQAESPWQGLFARAGREQVADLEKLADPTVEHSQQNRLRRRRRQAVEQGRRMGIC